MLSVALYKAHVVPRMQYPSIRMKVGIKVLSLNIGLTTVEARE